MISEEDEDERWEALGVRAQELARSGRISEAIELVRQIPSATGYSGWAHEKTLALIAIASGLIEQGLRPEAAQILREALVSSQALHDRATWEEAHCLTDIAELLHGIGARDEALATWTNAVRLAQEHQHSDIDCVKTLAHIARSLAHIGEMQRATDVARLLRPGGIRDRTLWYLAELARGGSPSNRTWPEKRHKRDEEGEERDRYQTLALHAQELAVAGRIEEAERLVRQIPSPRGFSGWAHEKTLALITMASKLVEHGAFERATQALKGARAACEAMQDGAVWEAADCFVQIARLLARVGVRDEAIATWIRAAQLVREQQHVDFDCARILAQAARDLAQIGAMQAATEVARLIRLEGVRDRTLWCIAELARGGSPSEEIWSD